MLNFKMFCYKVYKIFVQNPDAVPKLLYLITFFDKTSLIIMSTLVLFHFNLQSFNSVLKMDLRFTLEFHHRILKKYSCVSVHNQHKLSSRPGMLEEGQIMKVE